MSPVPKIGDVIKININKEDMVCIVIDKKSYSDLNKKWTDEKKMLLQSYYCSELSRYRSNSAHSLYKKTNCMVSMCYELMCGNDKYWIREDMLLKYGKINS